MSSLPTSSSTASASVDSTATVSRGAPLIVISEYSAAHTPMLYWYRVLVTSTTDLRLPPHYPLQELVEGVRRLDQSGRHNLQAGEDLVGDVELAQRKSGFQNGLPLLQTAIFSDQDLNVHQLSADLGVAAFGDFGDEVGFGALRLTRLAHRVELGMQWRERIRPDTKFKTRLDFRHRVPL